MFGLGTTELILILAIILLVFGVGKLPQIGESMGKAIKELKKGLAKKAARRKDNGQTALKNANMKKSQAVLFYYDRECA